MPKPTKGPRLGGSPAHERIILANLASQLFEHGKITTTEARAKRVQPLAERLITKAKRGDLHARRLAGQVIGDKGVLHVLFTEIAPAVADRDGGYTRITKIGNRKGDNAPMAVIELVTESVAAKASTRGSNRPATRTSAEAVTPQAPEAAPSTPGETPEPGAAGQQEEETLAQGANAEDEAEFEEEPEDEEEARGDSDEDDEEESDEDHGDEESDGEDNDSEEHDDDHHEDDESADDPDDSSKAATDNA